jgi:1,6-anhydro-N-acetylmuramate kinase
MSGTSIDGLDAALVRIEGEGLEMRASFVRGVSVGLGDCGTGLRKLAEQEPMSAKAIAELTREFSLLHVPAVRELMGDERAELVCVHGQTVFHAPPVSWQLINASVIAHGLGLPVVSDVRAADIACGGQGAPLSPIGDWVLFRGAGGRVGVVNLGGFCNVTWLGDGRIDQVRARDVCACSQLLDAIARRLLGVAFDADGAEALRGHVHAEALEDLEGVLAAQAGSKRSLGTGDEVGEWVSRFRAHVSAADLLATACEAISATIARATHDCDTLLLGGGGVRNAALVRAIGSCCSCKVRTCDELGVPAQFREAVIWAVLGALCADRVPISLAQVTGVERTPIAGVWVRP